MVLQYLTPPDLRRSEHSLEELPPYGTPSRTVDGVPLRVTVPFGSSASAPPPPPYPSVAAGDLPPIFQSNSPPTPFSAGPRDAEATTPVAGSAAASPPSEVTVPEPASTREPRDIEAAVPAASFAAKSKSETLTDEEKEQEQQTNSNIRLWTCLICFELAVVSFPFIGGLSRPKDEHEFKWYLIPRYLLAMVVAAILNELTRRMVRKIAIPYGERKQRRHRYRCYCVLKCLRLPLLLLLFCALVAPFHEMVYELDNPRNEKYRHLQHGGT